jgi:alanine racemase
MKSIVEISKSALLNNFIQLSNYVHHSTKIMSVVKANAYGHGLMQVVTVLDQHTDEFAVYHLEEAIQVRKFTQKPILVLGGIQSKEDVEAANLFRLSISVFDTFQANLISKHTTSPVKIHISCNTGLNREGLSLLEFKRFIAFITDDKNINLVGIYSHFANIEDTDNPEMAISQQKRFDKFKLNLNRRITNNVVSCHLSSTAGIMVYEKNYGIHSLVRPGIGLYGMYPSKSLELQYAKTIQLQPALTWKTKVARVFTIQNGESVSYGCTWTANRETTCATIPVGYSDGLDRKFSSIGRVLINGQFCQVLGRVAMNLHVVDVSHLPNPQIGDEVVIIGSQKNNQITAEQIADITGTINYEVTTRIERSLPRILVD